MQRRRVVGIAVCVARVMGLLFVALAILSLPAMRSVTGNLAASLALVSSLALGFLGIVWLIGVQVFLRFFDQFLSRN